MPWTSDDAGDHTHHADTASKKKAWADTANQALKDGKSEKEAIEEANAVVLKMSNEGRAAALKRLLSVLRGNRFRKALRKGKRRLADVSLKSYDADAHTVEVVLSSGAAVLRSFGTEVLQIKPSAVNLKRLGTCGIPVIDSHNVLGIGSVLGKLQRVWFDGGKLVGLIVFDDSKAGRNAEGMVARGMLRAVSIGYRVDKWEITDPDGNVVDPEKGRMQWDVEYIFTAVRWTLFEVSLVSVPADQDAVIRSRSRAHGVDPKLAALSRVVTVRSGDLSVTYEFGERSAAGNISSNEAEAALARMRQRTENIAVLARMRARLAIAMRS